MVSARFEKIHYTLATLRHVRWLHACCTMEQTELFTTFESLDRLVQNEQIDVVELNLFVSELSQIDTLRSKVVAFYQESGKLSPAITIIPQPPLGVPCSHSESSSSHSDSLGTRCVAWEAIGVGAVVFDSEELSVRSTPQIAEVEYAGIRWLHLAGCGVSATTPQAGADVYEQSLTLFDEMRRNLETLLEPAVTFGEVVRTWLYLGDIVGTLWTQAHPSFIQTTKQRYKELNRARTDFFDGVTFQTLRTAEPDHPFYPASTGIGTDGYGVLFTARALQSDRSELRVIALENPRQVSAFDYGQHYSPSSPKFSRAAAVIADDSAVIFISGTASITGSESQHLNDAARQTEETLDNIATLISEENFTVHSHSGCGITLEELASVRVYVKNRADYAAIRQVCERRIPQIPTIYVVGDVCRAELLVEIEGIAYSVRAASFAPR